MRCYRQLRELSTRHLAEKLNIVPSTVLGYEQVRFPIPCKISVVAAQILQISESVLFDDFCVSISAPYTEVLHMVRKRYGLSQVDFAQKPVFARAFMQNGRQAAADRQKKCIGN